MAESWYNETLRPVAIQSIRPSVFRDLKHPADSCRRTVTTLGKRAGIVVQARIFWLSEPRALFWWSAIPLASRVRFFRFLHLLTPLPDSGLPALGGGSRAAGVGSRAAGGGSRAAGGDSRGGPGVPGEDQVYPGGPGGTGSG